MGKKRSWGWLGLLFSALVQGAPTLTVATDVWPPFRILAQDGQFHGLDIDILHALQDRTGIRWEIKRLPWGRALKQMESGQIDLMIGLAHTPERAEFIDYLQPAYYQCRSAFYGKAAAVAALKRYEDLRGRQVGYVLNSSYFADFDGDDQLSKHGVATEDQLLRMVERDRLELMIGTDCQIDYALSQHNEAGLVKAAYQPPAVKLYLGMSKLSPHQGLRQPLAQALQAMAANGEIEALAKPYHP